MIMTDANENTWDKRWFVLRRYVLKYQTWLQYADARTRPYLHVYAHHNEVEELSVINLSGVNIECNSELEMLLGVSVIVYSLSARQLGWNVFRSVLRSSYSHLRTRTRSLHRARKSCIYGHPGWTPRGHSASHPPLPNPPLPSLRPPHILCFLLSSYFTSSLALQCRRCTFVWKSVAAFTYLQYTAHVYINPDPFHLFTHLYTALSVDQ